MLLYPWRNYYILLRTNVRGKDDVFMYDRFLVKKNNELFYCYEISILVMNNIDILKHERTFDNGKTWTTIQTF